MNKITVNKKYCMLIACTLLIVASVIAGQKIASADEISDRASTDFASGEVIVVFDENVDKTEAKKVAENMGAKDSSAIATENGQVVSIVQLPEDQNVEKAVTKYENNKKVDYAQPNYKYTAAEDTTQMSSLNDMYLNKQTYFSQIKLDGAWNVLKKTTHSKTRVALLDMGADFTHPDLQTNINKELSVDATNPAFPKSTSDDGSHGTHSAGTIAATAGNNQGIAGVATAGDNSAVELISIDVFKSGDKGYGAYTEDIVRGLNYAKDKNAKVVNMSLSYETTTPYDDDDKLLEDTINNITDAGATVICASGNSGNQVTNYPGDFDACISVIGVDHNNNRQSDASYGKEKDISAPGADIFSTMPGNSYDTKSGTSMAAPIISGVVALMYSEDPSLTPDEVKQILYSTSTDIGASGFDIETGNGLVNAEAALKAVATRTASGNNDNSSAVDTAVPDTGSGANDNTNTVTTTSQPTSSSQVTSGSKPETDNNQINVPNGTNQNTTTTGDSSSNENSVTGDNSNNEGSATGDNSNNESSVTDDNSNNEVSVTDSSSSNESSATDDNSNNEDSVTDSGSNNESSATDDNSNNEGSVTDSNSSNENSVTGNNSSNEGSATDGNSNSDALKDSTSGLVPKPETSNNITQLTAPANSTAKPVSYNKISLKWSPVSGAAGYDIYRSGSYTGQYSFLHTSSGNSNILYTNTGLTPGLIYYYKIVPYSVKNDKKVYGQASETIHAQPVLNRPVKFTASSSDYHAIKISWPKINGAKGYVIYRSSKIDGNYNIVKTISSGTSSTFTDKSVKTQKPYYYKMRSYTLTSGKTAYSAATYAKYAKAQLQRPSVILKKTGNDRIRLSWKKTSQADGYQVYYSPSLIGIYTHIGNVKGTADHVTNTKLKSGHKYYYSIRAYKKIGSKKVYSYFSQIKGLKL